jgi:hypothetical protein
VCDRSCTQKPRKTSIPNTQTCLFLFIVARMTAPEILLWSEVIFKAMEDFAGVSRDVRPAERAWIKNDAGRWFFSDRSGPGTFFFACQAVGVDPGAIRRGLRTDAISELRARLRHRPDSSNVHSSKVSRIPVSSARPASE